MVRHTKLTEVVVSDYSKDSVPNKDPAARRRSNSRDRARRDSMDSVSYEKIDTGDEVSMAVTWQGYGVSISVPLASAVVAQHCTAPPLKAFQQC